MARRPDVACIASAAAIILLSGARVGQGEGPKSEPLSPGQAALLLDGKITGVELSRWAEMLADERPRWRATAARLATVSRATPLVPALVAALEKEAEPGVAHVEMIALGVLAPGTADAALFEAARRSPGALDGVLVRSLALRGTEALALAPRLSGLEVGRSDWEAYFAWATGQGREALDAAASAALETGVPSAWGAALEIARDSEHGVEEATLVRSLESRSAGIREQTYWHVLLSAYPRPSEGAPLARAFAAAPEGQESADGPATLGHELAGRAWRRPGRDRTALIESLPATSRLSLPIEAPVLRQLRDEERPAYGRVRFGDPEAVEAAVKAGRGDGKSAYRALRTRQTIMKTADFPADLVDDLMAAATCKVEGLHWAALEVRHDAGAKIERLTMPPMDSLSPECQRVARVLLLSSLVPGDRPPRPRGTDLLVLPLFPSFLSCPIERARSAPPPQRVDGQGIKEPRKVASFPPAYPAAAREQRRQGVVILEAVIAPTGCIRSVEVLRGVDIDLDAEALRAVTRWRYTPTLLHGVPVPVVMTVTVNFKLS